MLTFEDDFVTPREPRPMPESADAIGAQTSVEVYGGILSREPVHDLDAEAHAMANGFRRVRAEDKRVINAQSDVNQLVPFKYKWAWDKYLSACVATSPRPSAVSTCCARRSRRRSTPTPISTSWRAWA